MADVPVLYAADNSVLTILYTAGVFWSLLYTSDVFNDHSKLLIFQSSLYTTDILVIALYCSRFSHYSMLPTFRSLLYTLTF